MTASSKLEGLTLTDNWFVARCIKPSPCSTGGTFSHSYLATRGSQEAFVKAFLITTQAKRNLSSRSGIGGVLSAT